jgi:predicted tellurium resistance membrane protein TerC
MRNRWVLVTILCIVVMYIGLNALLLRFMDVTLILATDILIWIGIHLIINRRIKLWSKDHPEDARSYVEPQKQ